jgi:hypothetical protein
MTTFKKLPTTAPSTNAKPVIVQNMISRLTRETLFESAQT